MIAVLDYGIGNLRSAEKALVHVGADARLIDNPEDAVGAEGVVLPGVGSFGACAVALRESGLDVVAQRAVATGLPFLGICVGFQLMFAASEESPGADGLGIFPGTIRRIPGDIKLPQMQWNVVNRASQLTAEMFSAFQGEPWFYFVHSYAPLLGDVESDVVAGTCDYGGPVVVAVERGNCWGTQFHPEKSGRDGLRLLSSFVERCARSSVGSRVNEGQAQ